MYKLDKLEVESETLANYVPPDNSAPSTFTFVFLTYYFIKDLSYKNLPKG